MEENFEQAVKRVMSDILNIDLDSIDDGTSTDNTDSWDSANHIQLVLALRKNFDLVRCQRARGNVVLS